MQNIRNRTDGRAIALLIVLTQFAWGQSSSDFWEPAGNLIGRVNCFGVTEANEIFVGMENGIFRSTNEGLSWIDVTDPLMKSTVTALHITDVSNIFAGTKNGLFLSTDHGISWQQKYLSTYSWVKTIIVGTGNQLFIGVVDSSTGGGGTIYLSVDTGANWTEVYNGIIGSAVITCFASDTAGNVFGVAGDGVITYDILYKWDNTNVHWTPVYYFSPAFLINDIDVDSSNRFFAANTDGVIRSYDSGNSWQPAGMYPNNCNQITILPDNTLFVCTDWHGTFFSSNLGASWQQQSTGLPANPPVLDFVFAICYDKKGRFFAGTGDSGVYRSKQPLTGVGEMNEIEPVPERFSLEQNYPNPLNPATTIGFYLPRQSHITLKIFDMLGKEVVTLVNGIEEPGHKSVRFEALGLASGVYYYRLQAGDFIETKRLLVLR